VTEPLAAVAYLRVPTQGQAEDGNGLALQESACRDHAAAAGLELVGVITERVFRSPLSDFLAAMKRDLPGQLLQAPARGETVRLGE
jgi:DNA invertase Pin-like site-specific DNA recombinase